MIDRAGQWRKASLIGFSCGLRVVPSTRAAALLTAEFTEPRSPLTRTLRTLVSVSVQTTGEGRAVMVPRPLNRKLAAIHEEVDREHETLGCSRRSHRVAIYL